MANKGLIVGASGIVGSATAEVLAFNVAAGVTFVCIIPWFFVNPNRRLRAPGEPAA